MRIFILASLICIQMLNGMESEKNDLDVWISELINHNPIVEQGLFRDFLIKRELFEKYTHVHDLFAQSLVIAEEINRISAAPEANNALRAFKALATDLKYGNNYVIPNLFALDNSSKEYCSQVIFEKICKDHNLAQAQENFKKNNDPRELASKIFWAYKAEMRRYGLVINPPPANTDERTKLGHFLALNKNLDITDMEKSKRVLGATLIIQNYIDFLSSTEPLLMKLEILLRQLH